MRIFSAFVVASLAASNPAAAQNHDTSLTWEQHKKLARHPPQKTAVQSRYEIAADRFGHCVVKRAPSEAEAFVRAATASSAATKTPTLREAVSDCLPGRDFSAHKYVMQEQDVAIYRAVLRKNGLPVPK